MFSPDLPKDKFARRREITFIILTGIFLGSLAMLNILGISRFIDLSFHLFGAEIPFIFFIGVLPYPITFLATDLVSELFGKKRAQVMVWTGLLLNLWVLFVLWLGGVLPPQPDMVAGTGLPEKSAADYAFFKIRQLTFGATAASMIAYLTAQFVDVQIFHYLKKRTEGRHLWLRNNGSTTVSQLVDSVSVVLITHFYAHALPLQDGQGAWKQILIIILSSYIFKFLSALVDTIPFYIGVIYLSRFLNIDSHYRKKSFRKKKAD